MKDNKNPNAMSYCILGLVFIVILSIVVVIALAVIGISQQWLAMLDYIHKLIVDTIYKNL